MARGLHCASGSVGGPGGSAARGRGGGIQVPAVVAIGIHSRCQRSESSHGARSWRSCPAVVAGAGERLSLLVDLASSGSTTVTDTAR
eukprot:3931877-Rhodomonas_salina.1